VTYSGALGLPVSLVRILAGRMIQSLHGALQPTRSEFKFSRSAFPAALPIHIVETARGRGDFREARRARSTRGDGASAPTVHGRTARLVTGERQVVRMPVPLAQRRLNYPEDFVSIRSRQSPAGYVTKPNQMFQAPNDTTVACVRRA
jgi:hypothetical protein